MQFCIAYGSKQPLQELFLAGEAFKLRSNKRIALHNFTGKLPERQRQGHPDLARLNLQASGVAKLKMQSRNAVDDNHSAEFGKNRSSKNHGCRDVHASSSSSAQHIQRP